MRSWETRCSAERMYDVKCSRLSQRETIQTSSVSPPRLSERQTSRSWNPSKESTRPARSWNAAITASHCSTGTWSRETETYTAATVPVLRRPTRGRARFLGWGS